MEHRNNQPDLMTTLQFIKKFSILLLGSLFVQIVVWAIYSYLQLDTLFCGISVLVTALLYHCIQLEKETGLSRISVFFAIIFTPFLIGAIATVYILVSYPDFSQTGSSSLLQLVSLYGARLTINGAILLLFSLADAFYLKERQKNKQSRHYSD